MYLPKSEIYNNLKELNYYVSQSQPSRFNTLPAIIFNVGNNSINVDLDNEILSQDIEVIIDIWANTSVQASEVLKQVEKVMRNNNYLMTYSADIPNTGNIYHINTRFRIRR